MEQQRNAAYDLVFTDIARNALDELSYSAGLDALQWIIQAGGPPVIVYAGRNAVAQRYEMTRLGEFGSMNLPGEPYALVDQALGRTLPMEGIALEQ